jgi:zinc D-Ala-D-Ala carboxypeptidase
MDISKDFFSSEVDLESKIPGAEDFRYKEFIKSDTALRKNISNIPSKHHWRNIEKLAINVLQPSRNVFGPIRITSGYRSKELNLEIRGSKNSLHCFGYAADIEPISEGIELMDLLEWIYHNCDFQELIAEFFPLGWVHVGYVEGRNERILKLKDDFHDYEVVSLNYLKDLY